MIQRSPQSQASGPPKVLWSLLVILAAVVGGLAAAAVVHLTSRWVSVAVPVLIGLVVALVSLRERPRQTDTQVRGHRRTELGGELAADASSGHPGSRPDPQIVRGEDPAKPPAVWQVHGWSPSSAADTPWWVAAQAPPPAPGPDVRTVPAPDLSSYLSSALIAQCPRCGAFGIDIRRDAARWTCRCESCEHLWRWQPGTPWPQVRVSPRLRTQQTRPASDTRYPQN